MNGFARAKLEGLAANMHLLALAARQIDLDAAALPIVAGVVFKGSEMKIGLQFAIDARQQIEIEFGGDAGSIVIGDMQNARILDEISSDDQQCVAPKNVCRVTKQFGRLVRLEIADSRAG